MNIVLLLICALLTFFLPFLAIPVSLFGLIFSHGRIRKCYGFLLALSLATTAYIWIPDQSMDLYRHHIQVAKMANFNIDKLGFYIKESLEPACYLIEFFVAQTNNYNLLQFIVVLCGYFELFWLLCDYADLANVKSGMFALLLFYIIAALRFIDFASGLWFNFAVINIAMGIYVSYFKKRKYLQYLFYGFAVCLHIGVLYIVAVMFVLNKLKCFKTIRLQNLLIVFLIASSFGLIVFVLNNLLGSDFALVKTINTMYEGYFINGARFETQHTGFNVFARVATIVISFVLGFWYSKNGSIKRYGSFVAYLSICIIATIINASVFARYGFLMVLLGIPLIVEFFKMEKMKEKRLLVLASIIIIAAIRVPSAINQMNAYGLTSRINQNLTNNLIYIMRN